jgi:hypothetical protein
LREERAAFLRRLEAQKPRRALGAAAALGVCYGLYLLAAALFGKGTMGYTLFECLGSLAFLGLAGAIITTPWTVRQREAMWRTHLRRTKRDPDAV